MPEYYIESGNINQYGMWTLFGREVSGVPLAVIWFVEAIIIMGIPLWMVFKKQTHPCPFFLYFCSLYNGFGDVSGYED
ncbi:MAG: hypothetical protein LBV46_02550 [Bacteroidales bacterium]|jgi:hypothetical protein|nr:hypothetical protein [Bacteroidales bacterium]